MRKEINRWRSNYNQPRNHRIVVHQADSDEGARGRKARVVGRVQIWDADGQTLIKGVDLKRLLTTEELERIDKHNKKHTSSE